jgi:uncharacterized protein HemX
MKSTARRPINRVQISKILALLLCAAVLGAAGVCYVSLKNTQHALGEKVRKTELQLRELRARNQDLQSRIASQSSRTALKRRLEAGFIAMIPIQDTAIARLTPPAIATDDGIMRTAANQSLRP